GYLITRSALNKWRTLSAINVRHFYWLRFSRIMPLLALVLLVLSLLHGLGIAGFVINTSRASWGYATFAALTFHINMYEIWVGYLPANWDILWSISVEEFFYLFFPIVCAVMGNRKSLWGLLLVFLFLSPWARTCLFPDNDLGDRNHLAYLDSIAIGCVVAVLAQRTTVSRRTKRAMLVSGWLLILVVFCLRSTLYRYGLVKYGLNITLLSAGVGCVLFAVHFENLRATPRRFDILGGLRRLGQCSYEVYLTHMFVIVVGAQIYKSAGLGDQWLIPYSLFLIGLSYLIGRAVFSGYSEPINQWLRSKW
ncbi:MAG: acyltransferase, partial [Myxococcota bacterium]